LLLKKFDIAPFALPNCPPGEIWFEESRDIQEVAVQFRDKVSRKLAVRYLQDKWPNTRHEERPDLENPAAFGWVETDDWFNGKWQQAKVRKEVNGNTATFRFRGLLAEEIEETPKGYDVEFRRTMALQLTVPDWTQVRRIAVYTTSVSTLHLLRVELDAGKRTRGRNLKLFGYNTRIAGLGSLRGAAAAGCDELTLGKRKNRSFVIKVEHMAPAHRYCGDAGLVEFHLDHDSFTLSLEALAAEGPIWYAEEGVYVALADDPTTFAEYRGKQASAQTINERVATRPEHSYARAFLGQPRPHAVAYTLGCKHSPQRFWLEPNGDLVLHKDNLTRLAHPGLSAARFLNKGNARFFFSLEEWSGTARFTDPPPVPVYHLGFRQRTLRLEQEVLCVPLGRSILDGEMEFDEPTVALMRFRFKNLGDAPVEARLPIRYSGDSRRSFHFLHIDPGQTEHMVPKSLMDQLALKVSRITSLYENRAVLRCVCETAMAALAECEAVKLLKTLQPGESCEALLKIPYLAPSSEAELESLSRLEFEKCYEETTRFWRVENRKGTQLRSPLPQLDSLHASHLSHVEITDFAMPDAPDLINTSVGSSTYGNFSNESCMVVQELDQRGFHDDCRRRLDLWVKYQGTATQPGNFSDFEGMYYGAGGFEQGHYNQHHGCVLWCMAEHFLLTRDREWFGKVAGSVIAGADWIFRQRRRTMGELPHSRGWEHGFLPAGSLEDVTEFYYWLSTNCLTWRGADRAAQAIEVYGHAEAGRIRQEADAFGLDLIHGFETMRQHAPLVRLRDGRWVPQYPSRLYCRGRDVGWIRQVIEGAAYLLISGLYGPRSRQASWILDDYQDNLYLTPPYGYVMREPEADLLSRGGFSIQPCLLPGLMPHLDRDEPEIYLWMFFNAFAAIYREEISGMIEHPMPELGFSTSVTFKTSDEANAVMWMRYLLVYWNDRLLHFGRALPRAWFAQRIPVELTGVCTLFGRVGVQYAPPLADKKIIARVELGALRDSPQVLLRFRHPDKAAMREVRVNGRPWTRFEGEDVDITGLSGNVVVEVNY
jgi:hypothetical protein